MSDKDPSQTSTPPQKIRLADGRGPQSSEPEVRTPKKESGLITTISNFGNKFTKVLAKGWEWIENNPYKFALIVLAVAAFAALIVACPYILPVLPAIPYAGPGIVIAVEWAAAAGPVVLGLIGAAATLVVGGIIGGIASLFKSARKYFGGGGAAGAVKSTESLDAEPVHIDIDRQTAPNTSPEADTKARMAAEAAVAAAARKAAEARAAEQRSLVVPQTPAGLKGQGTAGPSAFYPVMQKEHLEASAASPLPPFPTAKSTEGSESADDAQRQGEPATTAAPVSPISSGRSSASMFRAAEERKKTPIPPPAEEAVLEFN